MTGSKQCPVCLIPAERARDKDYGERKQIDCPRCGPYEISGTALAMLGSRVAQDTLARARLSHAIRRKTSENNKLFVSSANLDELAQQPLPGVPQQLEQLVRWLAAQLGEDRFGRIPSPWPELLASVVGATDGDRVQRLLDYAVKEGLVDRDEDADALGLSPKGWLMAEPSKKETEEESMVPAKTATTEIVKAHCNVCGGEKNSFRRAAHSVDGKDGDVSWSDKYEVLECCGCSKLFVRHEFWFSEWDTMGQDPVTGQPCMIPGVKVTYWPPPTKREKPNWANELNDDALRRVIDEVYQALNYGLIVMASIGTRTLLDRAMFLRVGDPKNGFIGKLDLMVQRGHIGNDEKDILQAITDAGSAAAHRGFVPNAETLTTIISTVENFLHREFVLKKAAGMVRAVTPSRGEADKKQGVHGQ